MAFEFHNHQTIPDVKLIFPKKIMDDRGWFQETYVERDFRYYGNLDLYITQENHSSSKANVFRGMHYQLWPNDQGKLVRCLNGSFIDYFVDLRQSSGTFGKIGNYKMTKGGPLIWIPSGFAHGVLTLEDNTELLYKCDNRYSPLDERGINPHSIIKDLPDDLIINPKDLQWPSFESAEYFP